MMHLSDLKRVQHLAGNLENVERRLEAMRSGCLPAITVGGQRVHLTEGSRASVDALVRVDLENQVAKLKQELAELGVRTDSTVNVEVRFHDVRNGYAFKASDIGNTIR
jgi:hypothetical protein